MKRMAFPLLVLLAVGLAVAVLLLRPPRPKADLSIVLAVIDSLRADHVGAYGYARDATPRIDALARDGALFTKAYSQAPWTKPSIASIFTSTYVSVHRVLYSRQIVGAEPRTHILNDKFLTLAEALRSGGYATAGFGQKIHLRPEFGFDQGFDAYDMDLGRAARVNGRVLSWLRDADPDRFFLYLHYNDPHYPYTPRPDYANFAAGEPRVQLTGETVSAFRDGKIALSDQDARQLVDLYDEEIAYTDHHLGKLIDSLEDLGYENMLVVATADHGEEFLDHGDVAHGRSLYDELVAVPLIVGGTGLSPAARGRRIDAGVELIDLAPTLLELSGLAVPPLHQGVSFAPLLDGGSQADPAENVYSERWDVHENRVWKAISDRQWKLILDEENDAGALLFDLEVDPRETRPVGEANPDVVASLKEKLARWSVENGFLYERIQPEQTTPLDPETEERLRALGYVR